MQKKKEMKEIEQSFVKQTNSLERELALIKERLAISEQQKKEIQDNYEKEVANLSSLSKNLKGDHQKELEEIIRNNETYKQKIQTLQVECQELRTQLDKDKILWENKCKFLESQRDTYKNDLSEAQKRFDTTVESIQRKSAEEKDKMEKTHSEKILSLETKYSQQIKDSNEKHNMVYTEIFNNNKALEKENKSLKLELDIKSKSYDPSASNKTIEDLSDQLERLKLELDQVKKNHTTKQSEMRSLHEKEKDDLKKKMYELETKIKEMETKRSNMLFEVELERGKWQNEKEHLLSNINDLKDQVETLTTAKENLSKENYKLKNEKSIRTTKYGTKDRIAGGVSMSSGGGRGSNPYANFSAGVGQSLFGGKLGNIEKIIDPDVSGIQNDVSMISQSQTNTSKPRPDFMSKFSSKYKGGDGDDSNISDK